MDPNLFHLDWGRTIEVIAAVTVLAFFLERGLALVFESRWYIARFDRLPIKEPLAFGVALFFCLRWDFDAVSTIVLQERTSVIGAAMTAAVIAGGSKASVRLFRDILGIKSTAYEQKQLQTVVMRQTHAAAVSAVAATAAVRPVVETAGTPANG